jgi:hypothetical protein
VINSMPLPEPRFLHVRAVTLQRDAGCKSKVSGRFQSHWLDGLLVLNFMGSRPVAQLVRALP